MATRIAQFQTQLRHSIVNISYQPSWLPSLSFPSSLNRFPVFVSGTFSPSCSISSNPDVSCKTAWAEPTFSSTNDKFLLKKNGNLDTTFQTSVPSDYSAISSRHSKESHLLVSITSNNTDSVPQSSRWHGICRSRLTEPTDRVGDHSHSIVVTTNED